jgi:DNA methylase
VEDTANLGAKQKTTNLSKLKYFDSETRNLKDSIMTYKPNGRWPANLLLDEESAEMLDQESGYLSGAGNTKPGNSLAGSIFKLGGYKDVDINYHQNRGGGASRFFYIAKADNDDRGNQDEIDMPLFNTKKSAFRNIHPTSKPTDLMEKLIILQTYLLKLMSTPTGGLILDPFCGGGSTLIAAKGLGRQAIGIEKEEAYIKIAVERLKNTPAPLVKI